MKKGHICLLLSLFLLTVSCRTVDFAENEMKGQLTVDLRQMGNRYLEVRDWDQDGFVRFIYPGKKIIQLTYSGLSKSNMTVTLMDSRRVQLARFNIPTELFDKENEKIFARGITIKQGWDFLGERVMVPLRKEHVIRSGGQTCRIPNCIEPKADWKIQVSCEGIMGPAFEVTDTRYDYTVHFRSEASGQDMGTFTATGSPRVSSQQVHLNQCTPARVIYLQPESFE